MNNNKKRKKNYIDWDELQQTSRKEKENLVKKTE